MTTPMYKMVRPDGTDFYSGTINYAENIGKIIRVQDFDPPSKGECGKGLHACYNPLECFKYNATIPCRAFRVGGIGLLCKGTDKSRFKALRVVEEITDMNALLGFNYTEAANPVNPFVIQAPVVGDEQVTLLRDWDSVWNSVRNSVEDSVEDSVRDSVRGSVWNLVRDLVWDPVRNSVRDLVRNSVWDLVEGSVRNSVRNSVGAYIGHLFPGISEWKHINHAVGVYPFQSCVDLWKQGFIPSFDGSTWRLHAGKDAKIVYEIMARDLQYPKQKESGDER